MERRSFLRTASVLVGAATLPLASHGFAATPAPLWQLLWSSSADAGSAWRSMDDVCVPGCDQEELVVTMDAFHTASGGNRISNLAVRAIFDLAGGESAPFLAWQFGGIGAEHSATASCRFVAGRASMYRLQIDYRHAGIDRSERCELSGSRGGLLGPGHYLLVGPDASGRRARVGGLVHSGDAIRPLASPTEFDYLAFRVAAAA
jgi:hypothetical protein